MPFNPEETLIEEQPPFTTTTTVDEPVLPSVRILDIADELAGSVGDNPAAVLFIGRAVELLREAANWCWREERIVGTVSGSDK